jgi:YD repeat-containing protein
VSTGVTKIKDGLYTGVAPNDKVETMTYDARGNMLTRTDKSGATWTWTYNARNQVLTETRPAALSSGSGTVTTTNTYDGAGNLSQSSTPTGNGSDTITWLYGYTDAANPGAVTSVTDPRGKVTLHEYDGAGNLVATTDPTGRKTTWTYDTAGRLATETTPRGNAAGATQADYRTTFTVNAHGDVTKVTDPMGAESLTGYDSCGSAHPRPMCWAMSSPTPTTRPES